MIFSLLPKERKTIFTVNRSAEESTSSADKIEVFKTYFGRSPVLNQDYFSGIRHYQDGVQLAKAIFSQTQPPQTVIANSDEIAAGIITGAKMTGKHYPEDFIVTGESNMPYSDRSLAEG